MDDLFDREQQILDGAVEYLNEVQGEYICGVDKYGILVKEYGRLLKQLRRVTKISDKTTIDLNTSKLDLLDKVHYDGLTGIYNRRFLEENLRRVIKSLSRSGGVLSVLMMDVDFFKRYNDTYGHNMGDKCLKKNARVLAESLTRADDFAARYGGEEFVVALPNTDEEGARVMAERILDRVISCEIPHKKNDVAKYVTVSVGVTTCKVEYTHTGEDYIKCADKALYTSKRNGRNQYNFLDFEEALR